jgi:hypothetical protein
MIGAVNQHAGDTGLSHLANRYFLRPLHQADRQGGGAVNGGPNVGCGGSAFTPTRSRDSGFLDFDRVD